MYENSRSADGPKKPIEVLTDRLDGLINQFIEFNLRINSVNKRLDALEAKPKATRRAAPIAELEETK
jgi:uncharacterized coiled-coil DUF342 family protein